MVVVVVVVVVGWSCGCCLVLVIVLVHTGVEAHHITFKQIANCFALVSLVKSAIVLRVNKMQNKQCKKVGF